MDPEEELEEQRHIGKLLWMQDVKKLNIKEHRLCTNNELNNIHIKNYVRRMFHCFCLFHSLM